MAESVVKMDLADLCVALDVEDARRGVGIDGDVVLLVILCNAHSEGKMQCYGAVTTELVGQRLGEIAIFAVLCPVPIITTVLRGHRELAALRLEDGEEQGVHLRATIGVRVTVQVGAALVISLPVAGTPDVAAALAGSGGGVLCVVDGEVQLSFLFYKN